MNTEQGFQKQSELLMWFAIVQNDQRVLASIASGTPEYGVQEYALLAHTRIYARQLEAVDSLEALEMHYNYILSILETKEPTCFVKDAMANLKNLVQTKFRDVSINDRQLP